MPTQQAGSQCSTVRQFAASIALVAFGFVAITLMPVCVRADDTNAPPMIKVPEGFTVELVAGPPLVQHPTMAGFDEQGRLFVADGPGLNLPADTLLKDLPNLIRMLEDTDGDGRFDRSTIFADKMTFPMGALCHDGSVFVASPPSIWKLTDTDGDGVADERKEIVTKFGFTGNAADIHGCFLGPDGRLYWCDGRHGHTFVDKDGNQISKGLAARIFSCRTDGTNVEALAGGGMDNPVEVTFTAEGEVLGTVAIFDVTEGRHDALVHWVHGGAYPYYQKVLGEFKRTGDLLPPLSRFGQVAPSGVARYRGGHFGPAFRDNIFSAQFNTHIVVRTQIEREGATFRSRDEDFLVSDSQDFHPTDVLEDADGSLLVIDTGGWFRIGCPHSKIAKPEILGGIYRIRRTDGRRIADPRGLKLEWTKASEVDLAARLGDERPAVVDRTLADLARRGESAVALLADVGRQSTDVVARQNAVWALIRIGSPAALTAVRSALNDKEPRVRQAAVRGLGTHRDADARSQLQAIVVSDEAPIRREAATALGRIGQPAAIPALIAALRGGGDRFLEHSLIYALIEINQRGATVAGLADTNPQVRRAVLIALDQMRDGNLTRTEVAPLLDTDDVPLQRAALEVIERHPDWAAETAQLLAKWLARPTLQADEAAMVRGAMLAFRNDAATQKMLSHSLASDSTSPATRQLLLEVIARSDFAEDKMPADWLEQLGRQLNLRDESVVRQAVATIAAIGVRDFDPRLEALASEASQRIELRVACLAVLARHGVALDADLFHVLTARLSEVVPPVDRLAAAEALGAANLNPSQLTELAAYISKAGPLELPPLVQAFQRNRDPQAGLALIAALQKSPGVENLSAAAISKLVEGYPTEVQVAAEPLIKRLSVNLEQQRAKLNELLAQLGKGDADRGKLIFANKKISCTACHRVKGEGGQIGPELTKIGQIRSRTDILESVIFPSSSFARGYESYSLTTDAGQVHTGIVSRETADAVYLRTAQRDEIRIARPSIEEMTPSRVSIMPQGLDKQLTVDELRDLLAYLESLK